MGVFMPNYSKGRRKDGDRDYALKEPIYFRTLCLPDEKGVGLLPGAPMRYV
jgi:hypothetical protein